MPAKTHKRSPSHIKQNQIQPVCSTCPIVKHNVCNSSDEQHSPPAEYHHTSLHKANTIQPHNRPSHEDILYDRIRRLSHNIVHTNNTSWYSLQSSASKHPLPYHFVFRLWLARRSYTGDRRIYIGSRSNAHMLNRRRIALCL